MLDADLAEFYQVETFNLNKAVKGNLARFPEDFMFRLTKDEADSLTFQIGMSKASGRGGRRYLPYAFTEHGVSMLSSVLNTERAVLMNIVIIRSFIKLREIVATHKDLARKIEKPEADEKEHRSMPRTVTVRGDGSHAALGLTTLQMVEELPQKIPLAVAAPNFTVMWSLKPTPEMLTVIPPAVGPRAGVKLLMAGSW